MRNPQSIMTWPVLKRYDSDHLSRIALPLGGIGTGTVSLSGRGNLRDWEIVNRPAKGFTPQIGGGIGPFFALWSKASGAPAVTRVLEGPLDTHEYEGSTGTTATNHGLPRFRRCRFEATYPFGRVRLSDPDVPVQVELEGFNPFIPGDTDASSIPVAVFTVRLHNRSDANVAASVCAAVPNFIGGKGKDSDNHNRFAKGKGFQGLRMTSAGTNKNDPDFGTMALLTTAAAGVSWRTDWADTPRWNGSLIDFWDDFSDDGRLRPRKRSAAANPTATLAVRVKLKPGQTREIQFLITWHFPNRGIWFAFSPRPNAKAVHPRVGNYYAGQYRDAWHVASRTVAELPALRAGTIRFLRAFCGSDLPDEVKEAALFNLSTLRTQTCFRTSDGNFFGWEGCYDEQGCCHGSCTHVWNYEQATAFLFADLSRTMRQVEFVHATDRQGRMSFRVKLPLSYAKHERIPAADGQMGCIMKMYRDWQLCGDDDWLRKLWPKVKKALQFAWIEGGWDADKDGVMEGCQHNTMDVEYYGPNPQMGIWYLGALRAAEEMATYLGDMAFADECKSLFTQGSAWIDSNLFNGEYYEHHIRDPGPNAVIAKDLGFHKHGRGSGPDFQLGRGCLIDQLVGQYMAHVCGLGYLIKKGNAAKTLRSVRRYNRRVGFAGHFNPTRSFTCGDEDALIMAAYPTERPARPFPYYAEVMTGFEYTAAVGMIYEGQERAGLDVIAAVRSRYAGDNRNSFNEAECGHHYARAMASWAAVIALSGFNYSAVTGTITFSARPGRHFWANGSACGTCTVRRRGTKLHARLCVLHGRLKVRRLVLDGHGERLFSPRLTLSPKREGAWTV